MKENKVNSLIKRALIEAPDDNRINDIDEIKNIALRKHKSNISQLSRSSFENRGKFLNEV
jgi:hypothetical protein